MKTCWGLNLPRAVVVYVYPRSAGDKYNQNASKFVVSYKQHQAGYKHKLVVISNGGPPSKLMMDTFGGVDANFDVHDNSGWDIGAFQMASRKYPCEFMIFMGSSAYVTGSGWLDRMMEAGCRHGWAFYGSTSSGANLAFNVYDHIRTTGFWCDPGIVANYPHQVTKGGPGGQRYAFEHGEQNITRWAELCGAKPIVVTWHGEYDKSSWKYIPEGFRVGSQSAVIVRDRITDL